MDKKINDGSTASYYELPEGATELQDLIEAKKMSFYVGYIFKAAYIINDKNNIHILNEIILCAQHEKNRIKYKLPNLFLPQFSINYKLPEGATELQDLIEAKNMNFSIGNIFKAAYRMGDEGTGREKIYDLNKIIFYAQREKNRLTKTL